MVGEILTSDRPRAAIARRLAAVSIVLAFVLKQLSTISGASPTDWRFPLAAAVFPYVGLLAASALAMTAGRPRLAVAIPVGYVGLGWLVPGTDADGVLGFWSVSTSTARFLGLACAVAPVVLVALPSRPVRSTGRSVSIVHVATVAWMLGATALVAATREIVDGTPSRSDLELLCTALMTGAAAGANRFLTPLAIGVAALRTPALHHAWAFGALTSVEVWQLAYLPAVTLVGSSFQGVQRLWTWIADRPTWGFAVVSALNVIDAGLTEVALRTRAGTEANPIINAIGLPAKVLVGTGAAYVIMRTRPRALVLPASALSLVLAWHLIGWMT